MYDVKREEERAIVRGVRVVMDDLDNAYVMAQRVIQEMRGDERYDAARSYLALASSQLVDALDSVRAARGALR